MKKKMISYKNLITVSVGFLLTASVSAETFKKSIPDSSIFGYHPHMNSIGTVMYRAYNEGNRGAIDKFGNRLPTVGSIIGFNDLSCEGNSGIENRDLLALNINQAWQQYFDFVDQDGDLCDFTQAHQVDWYYYDVDNIEHVQSWDDIIANAVHINQTIPSAIIQPNTMVTIPLLPPQSSEPTEPGDDETEPEEIVESTPLPISGKVTSSLRVPSQALGKYIAVKYTPKSKTGVPIDSKAVTLWDLNYFYSQTPASSAGVFLIDEQSLKTNKLSNNRYVLGSGGGRVQEAVEQPDIKNVMVAGVFAPGRKLTLSYDFIPYPISKPDRVDSYSDESVYFWGNEAETRIPAEHYDEWKSFAENQSTVSQQILMTKNKEITLTLDDVGQISELSILPIRETIHDAFPIAGQIRTYDLFDFEQSIEPLQRPNISGLIMYGTPQIGLPMEVSYYYTPSNSAKPNNASHYVWSYEQNIEGDVEEVILKEGYITTNPESIPNYEAPLNAPDSGPLDLGEDHMIGIIVTFKIHAIDEFGLEGNWAEIDNLAKPGVPNDMFAIKLSERDYGGTFPQIRDYGRGFPSTGFAGASFRLFAESFDLTKNKNNWKWDVVENSDYAFVDTTGKVTLRRIPPRNGVIRVTATNKKDPTKIKSHSFTIKKWLLTFKELSGTAKNYTLPEAKLLCENFTREDVTKAYLPSLADYTVVPVNPSNKNRSKGAGGFTEGKKTLYRFPSDNFYSQWGQLRYYKAVNANTGAITKEKAFLNKGNYAWTSDEQPGTGAPIYTGPIYYGDWYVNVDGSKLVNTACIVYAEDFIPGESDGEPEPMAGIKLPYNGYPNSYMGFPTEHEFGKGYPSLGFNGATFNLFAEDDHTSSYFKNNNLYNNAKWSWQINGGSIATSQPSKNQYALVTKNGQVTLVAPPPKGTVITITATSGSRIKEHSFTIDKWLYGYKDLKTTLKELQYEQTLALCKQNGLDVPSIIDYSSLPVDSFNPEQSLGFTLTNSGWVNIYQYPSESYFSQWGEFRRFGWYDPVTFKKYGSQWPSSNNFFWSTSKTSTGFPIVAELSGAGRWKAFKPTTSKLTNFYTCLGQIN